jgi:hypothetical protein
MNSHVIQITASSCSKAYMKAIAVLGLAQQCGDAVSIWPASVFSFWPEPTAFTRLLLAIR